jgi:hypothetical protein
MNVEDGRVLFGEWFPDRPFFENPGLVEAKNAIPVDDYYKDFLELSVSNATLAATPNSAFAAVDSAGDVEIYAGTQTQLYEDLGGTWTVRSAATYTGAANGYWSWTQFDNYVIATDYVDRPQYKDIGTATAFATVTAAPFARQIGKINRFVLLGDVTDGSAATPYRVQWSSIDDPLDWPTPGTSTALARQAGQQDLDSAYGAVTGISNGQFYGLVFQERAITRFQYIGGNSVFQVDTYERSRGLWAPRSLIQVGNVSYFFSVDGFYMTDGQSVVPIGDGKVDKWFLSFFDQGYIEKMTCGVDWSNKCVYWSFPSSSGNGTPDYIIIYNFARNRWAWAEDSAQLIFPSYSQGYTLDQLDTLFSSIDDMSLSLDSSLWQGGNPTIMGFFGSQLGRFAGSSLTAVFETGESQPNSFGYTFVRGAQPLVTGNPTSLTMAIATRDKQDNAGRTFGSAVSRHTRSGICGFRAQGKFISARMTIAGGFDRAVGFGVDFANGGQV